MHTKKIEYLFFPPLVSEILSFYHQLSYQFLCDQKEECIFYFRKTEKINSELNFPLSITCYTERINFILLRSYYVCLPHLFILFI